MDSTSETPRRQPLAAGGSRAEIAAVAVTPLRFPLIPAFRAAVRTIDSVDLVLVRIRDTEGREGIGTAFAFGADDARPILAIARSLGATRIGQDALAVERHWREMHQALALVGAGGPALAALSAIDLALWDLAGKAASLPLWRMLGGARERIASYGSGGSLSLPIDELVGESVGFVSQGHRAIKLKAGHGTEGDLLRVRAVREAVGPQIRIAVDGNQQWSPKAAIRWAGALAALDLWWLEEPVRAGDLAGHAEVRESVPMDLATGETLFGVDEAMRCIACRAADVLMPNLQRVGGIIGWRKIAAAAELAGIRMAAHVHPEFQAHLMCAVPNSVALEFWPGWPWLWTTKLAIDGGEAVPPQSPGLGLELDEALVAAHGAER